MTDLFARRRFALALTLGFLGVSVVLRSTVAQRGGESPDLQEALAAIRADKTDDALAALNRELTAHPASVGAASLLDTIGQSTRAQPVFQAAIVAATDPLERADDQRQLAISYAFTGNCAATVRYEQTVINYWVTQETAQPQDAFYQEGEVADEAARVCLDSGDFDTAEQWYRKGTELGLKEPAPKTHPGSLWAFRLAHALGRLAARRGNDREAKAQIAAARRALDGDPAMAAQQERFFPYLTGYVALYTNDLKTAEADLTKALALQGNQSDPFMEWLLATTSEREGRADDAKAAYLKAYGLATAHNPAAAFVRPFVRRKYGLGATRAEVLRGDYDRYRANNDLTFYHLDIRVDPAAQRLSGKNTIRFKMLSNDTRIQLDLYANLAVDKILDGATPLKYTRELNTVWVDFPETLVAGREYTIDFYYSGTPTHVGRFGGFTFGKDPAGRTWIYTACEGEGAAIWWPNKDQWRDEVDSMQISVAIPNDLVDVSNGRLQGKTDLGDGYTRWDWLVHYPINNYDVSLNIGHYEHFADTLGDLSLDFYALPEDLDKAKTQFAQAKGMLEAYQHYFGEYPFVKDGYKLIEVPYTGMEHQSAVTYGNGFHNGYGSRPPYDWTGVGISTKFDFIIIHESGHEWFGNAITAADVSDMWIHEGWTTYLECLYVEYTFGHDAYLSYTNGYTSHVQNREPILTFPGLQREPPQDMYFKGALMLHTLRSVVDDDTKWFALLHDLFQHFKYQNIATADIVAFFNQRLGQNLTPVFNEYLRHEALPQLDLDFERAPGVVAYRWSADEPAFAMPVRVGRPDHWQLIHPTTAWQTMPTTIARADFEVATDLYYVGVSKF